MKIYYIGQTSMANRGCEALIRSTSKIIREKHPEARFVCPSRDPALDRRQWPNAEAQGIAFGGFPPFPVALKLWGRAFRALPALRRTGVPASPLPTDMRRQIDEADAVVVTGGDNISLDYGLNALYFWIWQIEHALKRGKPTHLFAASVGPFKDALTERQMAAHLRRYTSISVRESESLRYLERLGVPNVRLVADPAFVLDPAPFDISGFLHQGRAYLGLNVSPVVRKVRPDEASKRAFDEGVQAFVRRIVTETDLDVMLIPHVDPLAGADDNSDRAYMSRLGDGLADLGSRLGITPDLLNAGQIKYVLGRCRYFIGARTHATIGAISQGVPTVSIAYSVKAVGINQDLFGSTRYVLPTPDVTADSLWAAFDLLRTEEAETKALLAEKLPLWKQRAREAVAAI